MAGITLNEKIELARALFGPDEKARAAQMIRGTATADSADGLVTIQLEEGDEIEVGTIGAVREGDEVSILVQNNEPRVIAAEGWGDRVQADVDTASASAATAYEVAQATGQHFWHDDSGAHVTTQEREDYEAEPEGPNAIFNSAGVAFYDGEDALAAFGPSGAQVGRDDGAHLNLTDRKMAIHDYDARELFSVMDMRDESGEVWLSDEYTGDGTTTRFQLSMTPDPGSVVAVVGGARVTGFTISGSTIRFQTAPAQGAGVLIQYSTSDLCYSMKFGYGNADAPNSVALGYECVSSAAFANSTGLGSVASGRASHAEGNYTESSGRYSHAEGTGTLASGESSHAGGHSTVAGYIGQTAIGRYNDNKPGNLLEVGNGTGEANRSNAFEVADNGDATVDGDLYVNGTIHGGGGGLSFDDVYPVGSIYMSVDSTDPGTLFGGTWQRIQDTFLLAAGTSHAAGSTGGEETHTLTIAEMPNHQHDMVNSAVMYNDSATQRMATSGSGTKISLNTTLGYKTQATGGGGSHNNMPPYLSVYVWKRTA